MKVNVFRVFFLVLCINGLIFSENDSAEKSMLSLNEDRAQKPIPTYIRSSDQNCKSRTYALLML